MNSIHYLFEPLCRIIRCKSRENLNKAVAAIGLNCNWNCMHYRFSTRNDNPFCGGMLVKVSLWTPRVVKLIK